ncbi:tnxb [Cordylochernes scorpioides]|uniref:Tnxb n=1 Tax=Cordylochernes scorpioides TaxID=51811 RepID=A0ABY6LTQ6_9ARAC|nr:tnxb [Cordylochernes scorpioides]
MPGHRKRRQFKQTDAFMRGMVIGLKRAGWSIRQIAADTHLGASTVHRLWRRWLEQGNVAIYRNVGATRVTSARVDRRILRQAVAAPQATCTAILQHVQDTLDHSISTRTISRRLGVPNALYQQDNARQHTARISQQALKDVQMLPWPPYSPELSPIEHVWDIIGRHIQGREECKNARVDAMLAVMTNLALDTQEVLSGVPASEATWWTPSKRCCLKRSDCCLPPTPVYLLENSRRFCELLSPVLLLLSYTVLQLGREECENARVDAILAVMTNLALDTQEVLSGVPASDSACNERQPERGLPTVESLQGVASEGLLRSRDGRWRMDCKTAASTHAQQEPHKSMNQPPCPCKICASHQLPNQIHFHIDCPLKNNTHPKRINPGNDVLSQITSRDHWQLRVDLWHVNGNHVYATYEDFWIEDEAAKYKLHLSNYKGTAVRIHPQRTTHELTIAIEQEWALISNELLDALISITLRWCKF